MESIVQAHQSSLQTNNYFDLKFQLEFQQELLPESTIDTLCLIKQTGHIAVTSLTHPCISIFSFNHGKYEFVCTIGERTTPVSGLCEIPSI